MDDDAPAASAASAAASASTAAWPGAVAGASSSPASGLMRRFVLNLPPGYHFVPTNAELVLHYLRPRLANHRLPLPIFFDEHILHYHPDRLVEKYREYGEDRWFFFTRRERKHAGGSRPNRATPDNGHWNATGCPKRIRAVGGALVGCMRTLVFYEAPRSKKKKSRHEEAEAGLPPMMPPAEEGEASKGVKTEWTMYEYESIASEEEFLATCKMDAIVLCTIQKKKQKKEEEEGKEGETKKRTSSKRKEKGHEEAVPAGAEQGSCAGGKKQARKKRKRTEEPQEEDHVQGTLTETEAALEHELAVEALSRMVDFTVDPTAAKMSHCFFANTSLPVSTLPPPQETMTMASAARGDNSRSSVHPSTAAMENYSQFQAPPLGQQVLIPYLHQKILKPPLLGGVNNNCSIMAPTPSTWAGIFASDPTVTPPLEELPTASWIYQSQTPCNTTKIVPAEFHIHGFAPGLSNSNYGFAGDGHRLSTGIGGHLDLLGLSSFPLQPSFGTGTGSSTKGALVHSKLSVEGWRFQFGTQGSSGQT